MFDSSMLVENSCRGLKKLFAHGAIDETNDNLPNSFWLSNRDILSPDRASTMRFAYSVHLSSGKFQLCVIVSNSIPRTFPLVLLQKALSFFGHSSAREMFILEHTFLYSSVKASHQPEVAGATVGTSSSCL